MIFSKVLSLSEIKNEPFVLENIRWDLEPKDMMEPRLITTPEGTIDREPFKGYIFYIDNIDNNPVLALMRHTAAGYAETLAQIDEIPREMLQASIDGNKDRAYFSMFPINVEIVDWLKRELGTK